MRNRFFTIRLLRVALLLGAIYDVAFAVALVIAPARVVRTLGVPEPGARLYLWLLALLLAMVGALSLAAADDPRRYAAVVLIAAAGRLGGAIILAVAAASDRLDRLWPAAAAELTFGVAIAWPWSRLR